MSEFYELLLELKDRFGKLNPIQRKITEATIKGKTSVKIKFKSIERGFKIRWGQEGFILTVVDKIKDCSCDYNCEGCPTYTQVTFDWSGLDRGQIKNDYVLY